MSLGSKSKKPRACSNHLVRVPRLVVVGSNLTATGKSEIIPANVGSGPHRKKIQQRTLIAWLGLASVGFLLFKNTALEPGIRAAALTLLFPGAGYIACANVFGFTLLGVTYVVLPVCLFAWFGAGGIFFPVALWVLSAAGAYFTAGDGIFEKSSVLSVAVLSTFHVLLQPHIRKSEEYSKNQASSSQRLSAWCIGSCRQGGPSAGSGSRTRTRRPPRRTMDH